MQSYHKLLATELLKPNLISAISVCAFRPRFFRLQTYRYVEDVSMTISINSDKRTSDINVGVFGNWHIVTRLWTGISEVRFSTGSKMYLFSKPSAPTVGPTQPHFQRVAVASLGSELIVVKDDQFHMK